jgi:hypothetical protein
MYWEYFKYVANHKWNVFLECWSLGIWTHAFTHDLSKFYPDEFIPYAHNFYGTPVDQDQADEWKHNFDRSWLLHQNRNRHHWQHWVDAKGTPFRMSDKYIKQMIADWKGMARKFGDTVQSYYTMNKDEMSLHFDTRKRLEELLWP